MLLAPGPCGSAHRSLHIFGVTVLGGISLPSAATIGTEMSASETVATIAFILPSHFFAVPTAQSLPMGSLSSL